jgi:3-hydroxybutyryl-CoA dehydratase
MSSDPHPSHLVDTWAEASSQMVRNAAAVNRAAFAAWGLGATTKNGDSAAERIEPAESLPEWTIETDADNPHDLAVGDRVHFTKTITDEDVKQFAAASGDTNPLHLDDGFAEGTRFKGRIAHGTLVGGLISAALARLPGITIYLSQDLEFHNPVRIGDRVTAETEIVEDLGDDQYRLTTRIVDEDDVIIDGEAVVMIDEVPDEA